jgi:hypothetical protein
VSLSPEREGCQLERQRRAWTATGAHRRIRADWSRAADRAYRSRGDALAGTGLLGQLQLDESDARACSCELLVDVGVGAVIAHFGDLAVAEVGDAESKVGPMLLGELREQSQCVARLDGIIQTGAAGDDGVPALRVTEVFEVQVASFDRREAVGLVDRDNA